MVPPAPQARFATFDAWKAMSGIGRTKTYYLLAEGKLRAVKAGKRTLIDVESGLAWLASCPAANIRCQPRPRRAA